MTGDTVNLVALSIPVLALLLPTALCAQFSGLSSTTDGSSVYFATTLRLRNTTEPRNAKIFVTTQDSVSLFRARELAFPAPGPPSCTVGGFADYRGAEASSGGIVALSYFGHDNGQACSFPLNPFMTQLVTASGDINLPGITRISASGRYAINYLAATSRPSSTFTINFLDLQTGVQMPGPPIPITFPESVVFPDSGGRVIANDGTAIFGITDANSRNRGYLLQAGAGPKPFPVADGLPLIIDASGSKVAYRTQSNMYLLDLRTLQSTILGAAFQFAFNLRMSDDGRRLLYLGDGQVHVLDTATLVDRTYTNDPAKISEASISGDGKFVHAVTGRGRLIKINVEDNSQVELIGRTPYIILH